MDAPRMVEPEPGGAGHQGEALEYTDEKGGFIAQVVDVIYLGFALVFFQHQKGNAVNDKGQSHHGGGADALYCFIKKDAQHTGGTAATTMCSHREMVSIFWFRSFLGEKGLS